MVYKAKITSKGQITLPAELRKALGVGPGDGVIFLPAENGSFRVRRTSTLADLAGRVPWSGSPVPVEEMKNAIGEYLSAQDDKTMNPAARRRSKRNRKQAA
ncbi:AbrB/MazE/SpoVT family DNA-binding domain-containing protein [Terracidiphilus sp.]|jgi:AbrB family looped-hinge helix DNA binding protein|uniref:AbrB/MazE/SpoVT family DNA-binding domain-containing protein n=1 Tax=Terracidiphilus sp. TaxID=1964191 RepID=UPI003C1B0BB8